MSKKLVAVEIADKLAKGLPEAETEDGARSLILNLLEAKANGGAVVSGAAVKRIAEVTGSTPSTPEDFITIAEKSVRQKGDRAVFEWDVDPILLGPLKDLAHRMDVSMQKLVQIMIDQIIQRGMLYAIEPEDSIRIYVTPQQMQTLEELTGLSHVTGDDIVKSLESVAATPSFL